MVGKGKLRLAAGDWLLVELDLAAAAELEAAAAAAAAKNDAIDTS